MSKTFYLKSTQRLLLLFFCFLFTVAGLDAQKINSVSIALQTESISIPFTRIGEIHPGIEIGVNLFEKSKPNSTRRWNGYVGYFYHKGFDQSIYIRGEYEFSYQLGDVVALQLPVGLGYMHSFHTRPVYEQQSDGSFSEKTQIGRPHAMLNLGLGISYLQLGMVTPFIKYEVAAQSPFVATIPAGPRNFLKVGSSIKFN